MKAKYIIENETVMDSWDWEKNSSNGLSPDKITSSSRQEAWWSCGQGHSWLAKVVNRTRGFGCPYCAGLLAIVGENDLNTLFPDIASEWNYEKNESTPETQTGRSGLKVWWRCKSGHEWQAKIADRTNGHGCPYCSGRKAISGVNDLKTTEPILMREWDYEFNAINPAEVKSGSPQLVWWRCEKGHSWQASIKNRKNGSGCPYCTGTKVIVGENDIKTLFPELVEEWNYELNTDCKPEDFARYSNILVWWKGKCGHVWKDSIGHRTSGRGCPKCNRQNRTSFPEQAIFYYIRQMYSDAINGYSDIFETSMELDIYIPSLKIGIEYDGKAWHNTEKALEREIYKYKRCVDEKIQLIRIRESKTVPKDKICDEMIFVDSSLDVAIKALSKFVVVPSDVDTYRDRIEIRSQYLEKRNGNTISDVYPHLVAEWNNKRNGLLKPNMFFAGSGERVWWICDKGHEWEEIIHERTLGGSGCPYCSNHRLLIGFNDLESQNPILSQEWDYSKNGEIEPCSVLAQSTKKVWWICSEGHSWQAMIRERNQGKGCPYCKNKRVLKGYNDLETLRPDLCEEWFQKRNGDLFPNMVTAGFRKAVWWKCKNCGNEWHTTVSQRNRGSGCPKCSIKISAKSYTDTIVRERGSLASKCPDLLDEWIYEKNIDISPESIPAGSKNKVWWKCQLCNFEWVSTIESRAKRKSGCLICRKQKIGETVTKNSIDKNGTFRDRFPDLVEEWNSIKNGDLTANDVTAFAKRKVWWVCKLGHEWEATVASRATGQNCPYCSSRRILSGFNDLRTINPSLVEEWDYEKNGVLTPENIFANSTKKVWWKCSQGHQWQAQISNRNKGSGCPICAGNIVVSGVNDLVTMNPGLAQEWDYELNGDLNPSLFSPKSRRSVWWKCACGSKWQAMICKRVLGSGCPSCGK